SPELSGYMEIHDILHWVFLNTGALALSNILLLAAHRRRYEIALRRAEGARQADIFRQFLSEGLFIALIGLVLGVIAGMGIAELRVFIDPNVALSASIPWTEIRDAAITLFIVAQIASVGPAWRACRHDPVELLRQGR
ncbi:MAG: FtsX-like permease family protein, partial [Planctomycetota bacterium]